MPGYVYPVCQIQLCLQTVYPLRQIHLCILHKSDYIWNLNAAGPSNSNTQDPTTTQNVETITSLEHQRFLYPQPNPTILPTSPPVSNNKGKARDMEYFNHDYQPDEAAEDDEYSEDCTETSKVGKKSSRRRKEESNRREEIIGSPRVDKQNTRKLT